MSTPAQPEAGGAPAAPAAPAPTAAGRRDPHHRVHRAVHGGVHERAGHLDRQRVHSHHLGDLGVSTSQGTWVITSFAVANAITVPLTGWLTQRFGQVRLFLMSTLLFVLASWLCGFSPRWRR